MRTKRLVTLFLIFWGAAGSVGSAQTSRNVEALRGLKGVGVMVEDINPDVEQYGLTKSQAQTDVELRLRKAGIKVLTREEATKAEGAPSLYVRVDTSARSGLLGTLYDVRVQLALYQMVILERDPNIHIWVATWETATAGTFGAERVRNDVNTWATWWTDLLTTTWP